MGYKRITETHHVDANCVETFVNYYGNRIRTCAYDPATAMYTFTVVQFIKDDEYYMKILAEMRDNTNDTTAEQAEALNFAISAIKTLQDMGVLK